MYSKQYQHNVLTSIYMYNIIMYKSNSDRDAIQIIFLTPP